MSRPVTPLLTVDAIIIRNKPSDPRIVLIKRKNPPYGWALPGGFVEIGETVENAIIREVKEETSLNFTITDLCGVYSDPKRDTRFHTVTIVFYGYAGGVLKANDDASEAKTFSIYHLPKDIAFDHRDIIEDYFFDIGI